MKTLNCRTVYVVDDDREVRRSISFMLGSVETASHPFQSGADFLEALEDLEPGCVLLDIRMPQIDGFEVLSELARREIEWPVVVMTGHGEVPIAVRAMRLGAIDFLEKPFSEEALLGCLEQGWPLLSMRTQQADRHRRARRLVAQLSGREADLLRGLLAGHSNKMIAQNLGISLRTVEMHRSNMMARLQANSLAEALRLAIDAGIDPAQRPNG